MRITAARAATVTLLCAVFAGAAAGVPAFALEPGVHVDPGSPAAKEYALPLTQARQTGSSQGGALFGAGITHSARGGTASGGVSVSRSRGAHAGGKPLGVGGKTALAGARGATLPAAVQSAAQARPAGGSGSILALIGGGVLVLALGALGGNVLRGRRSVGAPDGRSTRRTTCDS